MTNPLATGPHDPSAQDECAACGSARWTHDNPTVAGLCPSFVELSYGTRMARFVEAAQKVARSISTVRDALQDTMRATTELYAAMQLAGLLPEEEPASATGKHAADRDAAVATQTIPAVESPEPSGRQPARLWSWDAGTGGWVQIDSGPAEVLAQGRDRRYQAAANNDIPGAAWLVRAPGDKPTGHPDLLGVPTT